MPFSSLVRPPSSHWPRLPLPHNPLSKSLRAFLPSGRTHRSNQVSAPEYVFLISELAGERRFASIVAKRLESLVSRPGLRHGPRTEMEALLGGAWIRCFGVCWSLNHKLSFATLAGCPDPRRPPRH